MSDAGVTRALAEYCTNFRFEDLPAEAVNETKRIILDTIGCGLGGYEVAKGKLGVEFARRGGGVPEASIVGIKGKFPAAVAAFANGELMNALDWCPVMSPAHVPPYVVPPVLALAESRGKSGKDLIAAAALAMEISGRLANATGGLRSGEQGLPRRVWGLSSNTIGGTAGAANLIGLDSARMQHALGASGYFAPLATHVQFQYTQNQGYSKYGPSGWMAQAAVTTAVLAEMGYHGDLTFLEGEHGYSVQNGADTWKPEKLIGGLGENWVFMTVGYKPFPTCGIYQSSVSIFVKMVEELDLKPEEIEEVTMNVEPMGLFPCYVGTDPSDHVDAATSGPYVIAVAAHRIPRGPRWQSTVVMEDPRIRSFMKKVKMGVNPRFDILRHQDLVVEGRSYPRHRPGYISIKARGQVFERSEDFCRMMSIDPDYSATNEELAVKFRENAEIVLSKPKTERAIDVIMNLDKLEDLSELTDALAD